MAKREVRAFGFVNGSANGKLQQDEAKTSAAARQNASPGEVGEDLGSFSSQGRAVTGVDSYMVPNFQGRSGQPDNQSTNRGKGRT